MTDSEHKIMMRLVDFGMHGAFRDDFVAVMGDASQSVIDSLIKDDLIEVTKDGKIRVSLDGSRWLQEGQEDG